MPSVSVEPKLELGVSQDGVLIEYLTVPVDALMRYSMSDGENGPPCGPEKAMLVDGVTIRVGGECSAGLCAAKTCIDNSIPNATRKKPIEAI